MSAMEDPVYYQYGSGISSQESHQTQDVYHEEYHHDQYNAVPTEKDCHDYISDLAKEGDACQRGNYGSDGHYAEEEVYGYDQQIPNGSDPSEQVQGHNQEEYEESAVMHKQFGQYEEVVECCEEQYGAEEQCYEQNQDDEQCQQFQGFKEQPFQPNSPVTNHGYCAVPTEQFYQVSTREVLINGQVFQQKVYKVQQAHGIPSARIQNSVETTWDNHHVQPTNQEPAPIQPLESRRGTKRSQPATQGAKMRKCGIRKWEIASARNVSILPSLDKRREPRFRWDMLCALACRNSPTGNITTQETYNFILHHFPYYRFDVKAWKNNARHGLSGIWFNKMVKGETGGTYSLKTDVIMMFELEVNLKENLLSNQETIFKGKEISFIKSDPRGINFFQKMIDGKLGLPRQLFYYVIGTAAPQFAGPENSALFYHLLSIGYIPEDFSSLFTQLDSPCVHVEPKFVEERMKLTVAFLSDARNIDCYRAGLGKEDENVEELVENYGKGFMAGIGDYFNYQRQLKSEGYKNWTTPVLEMIE